MSTFQGRMAEYQYLSIDRFDSDNLRSKMFFLSHCHEDHMQGIGSAQFFKLLRNNDYKIYMQEVTAHLLLSDSRYCHLKPHVVPLKVHISYPFTVTLDRNVDFVVTLLPAGHCPGSVMFLFEGDEGTVLYTGDIRLTKADLEQMPVLKSCNSVKPIKSIYFDSTFCLANTFTIPSRQQSRDALIVLVESWLKLNPANKVLLSCAAKYGQEYLFCELSVHFGMKIHIPMYKNEIYSKIPDIAKHVTTVAAETRIHACSYWVNERDNSELDRNPKFGNKTCPDCRFWDPNVMTIKPSMMYFAQTKSINKTVHKERGVYRIKYSSHSSLSEIREIIGYLKPERAYPNVLAYKSDFKQIMEAIQDLMPKILPTNRDEQPKTSFNANVELLTLKNRSMLLKRRLSRSRSNSASPSPKKCKSFIISPTKTGDSESGWDLWNNINLSSDSDTSSPIKHSRSVDDNVLSSSLISYKDDSSYQSDNEITYQLSPSSPTKSDGDVEENKCSQRSNVDLFGADGVVADGITCLKTVLNCSQKDVFNKSSNSQQKANATESISVQNNINLILSKDQQIIAAKNGSQNDSSVSSLVLNINDDDDDDDDDECIVISEKIEKKGNENLISNNSSSLEIVDEFITVTDEQKLIRSSCCIVINEVESPSDDICILYSKIGNSNSGSNNKQMTENCENGWMSKRSPVKNVKR